MAFEMTCVKPIFLYFIKMILQSNTTNSFGENILFGRIELHKRQSDVPIKFKVEGRRPLNQNNDVLFEKHWHIGWKTSKTGILTC